MSFEGKQWLLILSEIYPQRGERTKDGLINKYVPVSESLLHKANSGACGVQWWGRALQPVTNPQSAVVHCIQAVQAVGRGVHGQHIIIN